MQKLAHPTLRTHQVSSMTYSKLSVVFLATAFLAGCGGEEPVVTGTQSNKSLSTTTSVTGIHKFSGKRADYTIARTANGVTVTDQVGSGGALTLTNPTRLLFSDVGIAFDIEGTPGQAYRIYQAAFNRTPDPQGLGYWIDQMDKGIELGSVAAGFVASQEFSALYGINPSNAEMISKFYQNVLHRAPDQAGYDYWLDLLNRKLVSPSSALMAFGESAENKSAVASAIAAGISYTIYKAAMPSPPLTLATFAACPDSHSTQSPDFYQCMIGTIKGKTTFGSAECTLTIANDGSITLAAGSTTKVLPGPYEYGIYAKISAYSAETFFLNATAKSRYDYTSSVDIKVTSPKYAALSPMLSSGLEANLDGLSCKFAL